VALGDSILSFSVMQGQRKGDDDDPLQQLQILDKSGQLFSWRRCSLLSCFAWRAALGARLCCFLFVLGAGEGEWRFCGGETN